MSAQPDRLHETLASLIELLSRRLTREDRRHGWSSSVQREYRRFFADIQHRLAAGDVPHPRELPRSDQTIRGLDADGVNITVDDERVDRILDATGMLRQYADEAWRVRSRGS